MTMDTTAGRDHHGRFTRQPETVERDAQALKLRARGQTYDAIAAALGFGDRSAARKAVERGIAETITEPAAELRTLELERLDAMTAAVWKVLEARHVVVSHGHVVRRRILDENGGPIIADIDGDGNPVYLEEEIFDDAPVLAAVDRLLKIAERRARLLGLDAPARAEIGGQLTYQIVGVDVGQL